MLRSEIISKDYEVGEINPLIYNETVKDFLKNILELIDIVSIDNVEGVYLQNSKIDKQIQNILSYDDFEVMKTSLVRGQYSTEENRKEILKGVLTKSNLIPHFKEYNNIEKELLKSEWDICVESIIQLCSELNMTSDETMTLILETKEYLNKAK